MSQIEIISLLEFANEECNDSHVIPLLSEADGLSPSNAEPITTLKKLCGLTFYARRAANSSRAS
jgi:hypothetical protein